MKPDKLRIAALVGEVNCEKDFLCLEPEHSDYCSARDTGLKSYLQCNHTNGWACGFSIRYASVFFCKCPLCLYLTRECKK